MANIKIAQLTNQINIADTDLIIIETATSTNKMTIGTLKNLLGIQYGGVEDSGMNANGSWVSFKDGTMICTMPVRVLPTRVSVFLTNDATQSYWAFPKPFNSTPVVTAVIDGGNTKEALVSVINTADTSVNGLNIRAYHPTGSYDGATTVYAKAIAVGRWK